MARRNSHFEEIEVVDHSVFQNLHPAVASDAPSLHGVLQCKLGSVRIVVVFTKYIEFREFKAVSSKVPLMR